MPKPVEVGPAMPGLLSGQGAQEERREAPANKKAQGKECAVQASPPPEIDKAIAWHLQW